MHHTTHHHVHRRPDKFDQVSSMLIQTGSEAYLALCPLDTTVLSSGVKWLGGSSPPSSVEVKNVWSYTSLPHVCMPWCLVKHLDGIVLLCIMNLSPQVKLSISYITEIFYSVYWKMVCGREQSNYCPSPCNHQFPH
jgi:hypothetical protein